MHDGTVARGEGEEEEGKGVRANILFAVPRWRSDQGSGFSLVKR